MLYSWRNELLIEPVWGLAGRPGRLSHPQMATRNVLILLLSLALVSTFHQYREIVCKTKDGKNKAGPEKAKCQLVFKNEELERGRDAPQGLGCFTERARDDERELCDLVCPKAHTVFVAHIDVGHRACFNYFNYELEQRKDEWLLMRRGDCANSTITFRIGCKFDEPFNATFKSDNEIFARLRAARSSRFKY